MGNDSEKHTEVPGLTEDVEETHEVEAAPETGGTTAEPVVSILTDPVTEFQCSKCGCRIDTSGLTAFTQVECPDCGAIEGVPARLGNFVLLKLLGMGGMGGVFHARDETLGRFVAIKVMLQSLGDNASFIETFRREAQAIAKLNHPNIAQIYSFGQEKGQPYIVMELVNGEHVDEMVEQEGGISAPLAMSISFQVAQGLSAADEAGIVHGDVKPENILLNDKGVAKVVDFGLATVAHAAASDGIWGTPYYIAPEKIRRQKVDARADIYSLGATLYHILTGKPPFEGETPVEVVKARLEQPPPDIKEECPDLPDEAAQLVTRMLATERTERYPTYKSLLSDMRKALQAVGDVPVKQDRLAGKHIRIKKRTSAAVSSSTTGDATKGASAGGGHKNKIIIRKDKGAPAILLKRTSQVSGKIDIEDTAKSAPTPEELEAKRQTRKKHLRSILTVVAALLVLGIIGGIVTVVVQRKRRITEERAEWFARTDAREAATASYALITEAASKSAALVARTSGYEQTILEAILAITGQELVVPELPPEPEPEPAADPEPEPEPAAEPEPEAAERGTEAGTTNAAATEAESDTGTKGATEAKPEAATDDEAEAEAEAEAEEAAHEVEEAEAAPEIDLPPIAITARNTIINLQKLRRMNGRIQGMLDLAEMANTAATTARKSSSAKSAAAALKEMADKAVLYLKNARELYGAVREKHPEIVSARNAHDAAAEDRRQAELEEQKRLAEAAARKREQLALEELTKTEIARAQIDKEAMAELFAVHDFDAIVSALEDKIFGYQTEGGRAAFMVVVDRYKYVAAMRDQLITCINAEPFPWGWGTSTSARDVSKASKKGVSIVGSSAIFPWKAVNVRQMLKFVDHYLASRKLRATDKANLAFGAAIYCDEFGEKGQAKAKSYLNRALDLGFPRDEQERLIEIGW